MKISARRADGVKLSVLYAALILIAPAQAENYFNDPAGHNGLDTDHQIVIDSPSPSVFNSGSFGGLRQLGTLGGLNYPGLNYPGLSYPGYGYGPASGFGLSHFSTVGRSLTGLSSLSGLSSISGFNAMSGLHAMPGIPGLGLAGSLSRLGSYGHSYGYNAGPGSIYGSGWGNTLGISTGNSYGGYGGYGGFGNSGYNPSPINRISSQSVIQTAPSKPAGNYYAPSTPDPSAAGNYYASNSGNQSPASSQNYSSRKKFDGYNSGSDLTKPQKNYWGGSGSPFPKDLNSTPWSNK